MKLRWCKRVTKNPAPGRLASCCVLGLALGMGLTPTAGAQARLAPPPGFMAAAGQDRGDCPEVPAPFTGVLGFPSKYEGSGAARDQQNDQSEKLYRELSKPITAFEQGISKQISRFMRDGRPAQLDCALLWLNRWSQANALLGKATTHTGASMRKWALGSIASAYLRLKFSRSQPLLAHAAVTATIEDWLGRIADQVVAEWSHAPDENFNNHEYWASWAVMAAAVALDRRDLFDWSVANYRRAAAQIDAEGYLANELARETRALQYHNYSLPPLAMIAAFAKANGLDLTQENDAALRRLATRTLAGVDDPDIFKAKTGKKQDTEGLDDPSKFSWLEPYCQLYSCSGELARRLEGYRPISAYRVGGDVSTLFTDPPPGADGTSVDAPDTLPNKP